MQSRQILELRQHQQLALTPQLQQSIRFLQLSALDLEMEIAQAISDNPLLERQEEYDIVAADPVAGEDEPDQRWPASVVRVRRGNSEHADEWVEVETGSSDTLGEHLLRQLHATRASPRDRALVTLLIEELDENGYLPTPLDEVRACLPAELAVHADELRMALRLLQSFDPPGVGAVSLADCLLLQLGAPNHGPDAKAPDADVLSCAREIARAHLGLLGSGNLNRLRQVMACSPETLRAAHALLMRLDPRPGRAWATSMADYVTPDVLVRKVKGHWRARLNPAAVPRVRVNTAYERWIAQAHDRGPLQGRVQDAHAFIKSLNQRFATILRVGQAIADHQQAFFEQGVRAMRPLLLRNVAHLLGLHESTVSRATRQKYMQTPWGVVELKRFFGGALPAGEGESISATAVRALIAKLVSEEPEAKPLSDSQIAAQLAVRGVVIARRTVAKYREAEGIGSALLRKTIKSL